MSDMLHPSSLTSLFEANAITPPRIALPLVKTDLLTTALDFEEMMKKADSSPYWSEKRLCSTSREEDITLTPGVCPLAELLIKVTSDITRDDWSLHHSQTHQIDCSGRGCF
mmetsp:Transcript_20212/g.37693  ORF Transcript_20212/g.37693 Transcript_20212/m.37693 type:complete len:111 (+) Transcript_20212:931-1263(+)